MVIEKYLYNDFNYKLETGRKPFLVNDTINYVNTSIPRTIWDLDLGNITVPFKDAIEQAIFTDPNNIFFRSYIGPAYYIGKYKDLLTDEVFYYLTYIFEYDYYNSFVNKPLSYTVEGSNHVIEGQFTVPADFSSSDDPIVIDKLIELPRKLNYLESLVKHIHKTNGINNLKLSFSEQASPLDLEAFTIGVCNVDYSSYC
jgi:hypothetical protein